MSRFRQRFYVTPLVLVQDHLRPVVDLYDVAWSWLADVGERRLVQTFAKPDIVSKMDRDRRMTPLEGDTFELMQELIHREGGAALLREALVTQPALALAAREALSRAPAPTPGDAHARPAPRHAAGTSRPR